MGPPKRGKLSGTAGCRSTTPTAVPVDGRVERMVVWPDERCAGSRPCSAPPPGEPPPQAEPEEGDRPAPRRRAAAARLRCLATAARLRGRRRVSGGRPVQVDGRRPGGHPLRPRAPCLPAAAARACWPTLPRRPGRPRGPPAHGLAVGRRGRRPVRAAHQRLPGAGEQDPAAARQRLAREAGAAPGPPRGAVN